MEQCVVLLGTATPSLESYHNAVQGKYRLLNLTQRVDDCQMPLMRIVDLRLARRKEKVAAILSEQLRTAITSGRPRAARHRPGARREASSPGSSSALPSATVSQLQPGSLSGEILLSPDEARCGGVLPLDVPITTACPSCEGTGGFVFDCYRCGGDGSIERRFPVPVRIPPGVRDGTVFQVAVDDPAMMSILLTVHIRGI
jgi:hypothetical protein